MTRLQDRCVWPVSVALAVVLAAALRRRKPRRPRLLRRRHDQRQHEHERPGDGRPGMGGMGIMPMMSAMNPSASLSPTDAAALGMQANGNGLGMNPMNGVFMNPMAAPYLLGYPMSTNQIGAMMMMNQMGQRGIGSGQLSGVRPARARREHGRDNSPQRSRGEPPRRPADWRRVISIARSASIAPTTSAGFRRTYYTRQNRYYPQVAR